MPRRIDTARSLRNFNPKLLREQLYSPYANQTVDPYELSDIEAVNQGMLQPIYDLLDRGGKRWRPVLGMSFAECFGRNVSGSIRKAVQQRKDVTEDLDLLFVCGMTEIIHNGSLIVDDLEDGSLMRRGDKCIHLKYGSDIAVNTGTFMYYHCMTKLAEYVKDEKKQLKIF